MFDKLIIDGNNLFYKCYYVEKRKIEKEKNFIFNIKKVYPNTIQLFLKLINNYIIKYTDIRNYQIYFLWDNPLSKFKLRLSMDSSLSYRCDLDKNYKKDRINQEPRFYEIINYLRLLLLYTNNNFYDLQIEKMEADDLLAGLLNYFKILNQYKDILIISEDLDWARGINIKNNILWYAKKKIYNKKEFKTDFEFEPEENKIVMYKTFRGDKSDNIPPGLLNIKKQTLLQIINDYKNIYLFLENYKYDSYISDTLKEKIEICKKRLITNYQLISFINVDILSIKENLVKGDCSKEQIKKLERAFNINNYDNIDSDTFFENPKLYKR